MEMEKIGKKTKLHKKPSLNANEREYVACYLDLFHSRNSQGRIPLTEIESFRRTFPHPDSEMEFTHVIRAIDEHLNTKE